MLIDFHTHTTASDGALSPAELVERALEAGIAQFAITDHDTVKGYRDAESLAKREGLQLISGVEFSCRWSGANIHIVGLGMDCDHPAMVEGLDMLNTARMQRARRIGEVLEKRGFPHALEGAMAEADGSQLGRPHFARWMVAQGHVADFAAAFDKYLGRGKQGDVKAFWPEMAEVVHWIVEAGGVAVIAHPLHYDFTRSKLRRLVAAFKEAGGTAIEVRSGNQAAEQIQRMTALAVEFDLEMSAGSDFHRDGPYNPAVGVRLKDNGDSPPVWRRWLSAESAA